MGEGWRIVDKGKSTRVVVLCGGAQEEGCRAGGSAREQME